MDYGYCKTEQQYIAWLRRALRNIWNKHPVKMELLQESRRRIRNEKTGRMCYHSQCNMCKKWFPQSEIEVNHKNTVGTLTLENMGEHAKRLLLVNKNDLEILCHTCHQIVTYSERSGMTLKEAEIEKKVIAFFKKYKPEEQKRRIRLAGMVPQSTIAQRRAQVRKYLRKKEGLS